MKIAGRDFEFIIRVRFTHMNERAEKPKTKLDLLQINYSLVTVVFY